MPMISWNNTTLGKPEGGLGLRNLCLTKHSLMAKNVLNYLNNCDYIWVDIIRKKYGMQNLWTFIPPPKCSLFFRGLCRTTDIIKPNLWINVINPFQISIWQHPWIFEIPLNFKPTFINMELDWDNISFTNFYNAFGWNIQMFTHDFGLNFDSPMISRVKIVQNGSHHWGWFPHANTNKIPTIVSSFLNSRHCPDENWIAWKNLWKLSASPRVKTFSSLLCYGKIKTYAFLHALNLGLLNNSVLYNLQV